MEFFDGMAQKTKNISEIMKLTAAVSSEKERQEKMCIRDSVYIIPVP